MDKLTELMQKLIGKIDIETKKGLKQLTAFVIMLEGVLYAHFFLLPYNFFGDWKDYFVYLVLPFIFYLLKILLFGSDDLYYGNPQKNKYAGAFQAYLPSNHIALKFNLTSDKAESYWFEKCFNPLKDTNHPRHDQRQRTFSRGFSCRFIYYFIKTMEYVVVLSIITLLLQELLPFLVNKYTKYTIDMMEPNANLAGRVTFVIANIVILLITKKRNKPNIEELTGVWRRFEEINKLHINWIDDNYKTIDDFTTSKP